MNMVDALIDEVEKRPVLWNKRHEFHSNRATLDKEWEIVATILGNDKYKVKSKWRNLRDQFLREVKKLIVPKTGTNDQPLITFYRGKWVYFERLLFMKVVAEDQIRKRKKSISEDTDLDSSDQIKLEEVDITDNSLSPEYYNDYMDTYQQIYEPQNEEVELETREPSVEVTISPTIKKENDSSRKRKLPENDRGVIEEAEVDDDMHFVKSLVPFLRKLTPVRKLMIRSEIQGLLLRELTSENQNSSYQG
ncbi:uncharacterized protein ACR2FA_007099 [Aphomia sociella]